MQIGPPVFPHEKAEWEKPTRIIQRQDPDTGWFITIPMDELRAGDVFRHYEPDGRLIVDKYGRSQFITTEDPRPVDPHNVFEFTVNIKHWENA